MRLASPHPGLRIAALLVVGLAIGASLLYSVAALRLSKDNAGRTTLSLKPLASPWSNLDPIVAPEGRGIHPAQVGSRIPTPDASVPVVSFEGLHFGTNGPYTNRLTPPD